MMTNVTQIKADKVRKHPTDDARILVLSGMFEYQFIASESLLKYIDALPGDDGFRTSDWVDIYCHQNAQTGTQSWYAFDHNCERDLFVHMLKATRVGPAVALKIMDAVGFYAINEAIKANDPDAFLELKGVPKAAGEALVKVLFKNKPAPKKKKVKEPEIELNKDAVTGLVNLGYNRANAKELVKEVMEAQDDGGKSMETSEIISCVFRNTNTKVPHAKV